jgi:hypothetical protein
MNDLMLAMHHFARGQLLFFTILTVVVIALAFAVASRHPEK